LRLASRKSAALRGALFAGVGVTAVDQITVEQRLNAEKIKLKVGKWIERIGEFAKVEKSKPRIETAQFDAERDVGQEGLAMGFLERLRPVGDAPGKRFFVNVG
jgi:hypothetical protein